MEGFCSAEPKGIDFTAQYITIGIVFNGREQIPSLAELQQRIEKSELCSQKKIIKTFLKIHGITGIQKHKIHYKVEL